MKRKLFLSFKDFLLKTYKTICFILYLIIKEDFTNYIKNVGPNNRCSSKKLILLGNGPSLASVLKDWKNNSNFKEADFLAVNYFCHDKSFMEIKPKYYVLSDPQFFDDNNLLKDKIENMFSALNKNVFWPMFLYIQYYAWRKNKHLTKITNKNITVIPFHSRTYGGYEFLRNRFFKHGLGNGNYGSVILNGEYIGINLGYKELYLYGVDHNFFTDLCVDDNNQICNKTTYFYDADPVLKPICHYYIPNKETKYTIAEYLDEKAHIFKGHEIMRQFSDYSAVKIYNCTTNSLIDAYERL
jgi:hypothetical protein